MKRLLGVVCAVMISVMMYGQECQKGVIDCRGECGRFIDENQDGYCDITPLSDALRMELFPPEVVDAGSDYWLWPILGGVALLYIISVLLVRFNVWSKKNHRKLWNVLLAITFLVSCLIGLLLVVFINYNIAVDGYRTWLVLHVDFGIAMTLICFIHLFWHWSYYVKLFKR